MWMVSFSVFFAKAFALYFLAAGIAMAMNPDRFRSWGKEIMSKDHRAMFAGIMAMILGAFTIAGHNIWVMDWPVMITLVGWISFLKGLAIMICPDFAKKCMPLMKQSDMAYRIGGGVWILVGLFLAYQGFMS